MQLWPFLRGFKKSSMISKHHGWSSTSFRWIWSIQKASLVKRGPSRLIQRGETYTFPSASEIRMDPMITATKYQVLFMAWFELVGFLSRDMWGCFFFVPLKLIKRLARPNSLLKGNPQVGLITYLDKHRWTIFPQNDPYFGGHASTFSDTSD